MSARLPGKHLRSVGAIIFGDFYWSIKIIVDLASQISSDWGYKLHVADVLQADISVT